MAKAIAAITGASSGIGAVFARKLAPDYDLLLIARRKDRLQQLAAELEAGGSTRVEIIAADLTSPDDTARVAERLGMESRLDLLVNNAGFGSRGFFWQANLTEQEQMHQLHVMATVRLTHAALQGMVARNRGGIINVASVAAFVRSPGAASYCSTKTWMTAFTEALYLELHVTGSRVRVQALCPGFTYSEFHDVAGMDRSALAPKSMWLSAERVVEESLRGLDRGKLFVIPGWRYRGLSSLIAKLPSGLRLIVERRAARGRIRGLTK